MLNIQQCPPQSRGWNQEDENLDINPKMNLTANLKWKLELSAAELIRILYSLVCHRFGQKLLQY